MSFVRFNRIKSVDSCCKQSRTCAKIEKVQSLMVSIMMRKRLVFQLIKKLIFSL